MRSTKPTHCGMSTFQQPEETQQWGSCSVFAELSPLTAKMSIWARVMVSSVAITNYYKLHGLKQQKFILSKSGDQI